MQGRREWWKLWQRPFAIPTLVSSRSSLLVWAFWWDKSHPRCYPNDIWVLPELTCIVFQKDGVPSQLNIHAVCTYCQCMTFLVLSQSLCTRHCSKFKGSGPTEDTLSLWGAHWEQEGRQGGNIFKDNLQRALLMLKQSILETGKERSIWSCHKDPERFWILKNE